MSRSIVPASAVLPMLLVLLMAGCSKQAGVDAPAESATATAPAAATTVKHAQGETTLVGVPQKVIVTDWASFDNLTALGVPVAGVPQTHVPGHLADKVTADMLRVGSMQEPDIEGIAAAQPDLVIVGARSRNAYATLSPIVPTIDTSIDNKAVIDGLKTNLVLYGEIFQRQDRAQTLIANLDARIAQARAAAQGKGTALVIVTNGGRIGIYGPESRVSWIYSALQIPSVFDNVDDRDHGGDAIGFEYLLKTDPDWLFVIDRDAGVGNAGSAHALLDNELLRQSGFWKSDRVVYLDPAAAYVTMHGYDAVMVLLDDVIKAYSKH